MYTAPGRGFLKVVGILYVIFSGLGILLALLAMAGTAALGSVLGINTSILTLLYVIMLVSSGYGLFLGIIGIKHCNDLGKAGFVRTCGIVDLVLRSLVVIWGGVMMGFSGVVLESFGLVLPILFLVGASKNVAAAASMQAAPADRE